MNESPIERGQREFAERARVTRPSKTAGSEDIGVFIMIITVVLAVLGCVIVLAS